MEASQEDAARGGVAADDGVAVDDGVAAGDGDQQAFARALYAHHGVALQGRAMRLADGDRQLAEDIVQETMLRAWLHREKLSGGPGVRPWLFAVARNISVDRHRARQARPPEAGADGLGLIPEKDHADRVVLAAAMAQALGALSPDHRRVIIETYYLGRTVADAAAILGIPQGTVKSRMYYGMRALRQALQELGLEP